MPATHTGFRIWPHRFRRPFAYHFPPQKSKFETPFLSSLAYHQRSMVAWIHPIHNSWKRLSVAFFDKFFWVSNNNFLSKRVPFYLPKKNKFSHISSCCSIFAPHRINTLPSERLTFSLSDYLSKLYCLLVAQQGSRFPSLASQRDMGEMPLVGPWSAIFYLPLHLSNSKHYNRFVLMQFPTRLFLKNFALSVFPSPNDISFP